VILAGIDPGVSGAAVIVDDVSLTVLAVLDLPVVRSKSLAWVDGEALWLWLQAHGPQMAIIEQVGYWPGDATKRNTIAVVRVSGGVEAILCGLRIPFEHVMPGTWKRRAGLIGRGKAFSVSLAKSRLAWPLRNVGEHQAEAALVALYGRAAAAPAKPVKRAAKVVKEPGPAPLFD
jgi:crossover junction endodeoxyribonuclease RuvC